MKKDERKTATSENVFTSCLCRMEPLADLKIHTKISMDQNIPENMIAKVTI